MAERQVMLQDIEADLYSIAQDSTLLAESSLALRRQAIEHIEFDIIEPIEERLFVADRPQELAQLQQYASELRRQLEELDHNLFRRLRQEIQNGLAGAALRARINELVRYDPGEGTGQRDRGYDDLDVFVAGLLFYNPFPLERRKKEPEMVRYQPTPARFVFEMIGKADLTLNDVFYDLGSGLGQVPILVNLLSGAAAKGVEFEPAYCEYASTCAADLKLSKVQFVSADARDVDYADASVLFMYTPFEGKLLQQVLAQLRQGLRNKGIKLFTYGPCTLQVTQQDWLQQVDQIGNSVDRLGQFVSAIEPSG